MIEGKDISKEFAHIDYTQNHYDKLFGECPLIKDLPSLENTIIAGGFVNIAIDDDLYYMDFATSDIDLFVAGPNAEKDMAQIFKFFDDHNAKYKAYFGVINIYLPDYPRNFQLIWQDKKDVFACIARFHSSHVKCGFYMGKLYVMPDCMYTIRTRIALIDEASISAFTMRKIMKRGYIPFNYEEHIGKDLSMYPSVIQKETALKKLETDPFITSEQATKTIKMLNFDRRQQIICPEIIQFYNNL